jgi:hypothetical protein
MVMMPPMVPMMQQTQNSNPVINVNVQNVNGDNTANQNVDQTQHSNPPAPTMHSPPIMSMPVEKTNQAASGNQA